MNKISLLGSTGSVGTQTLDVVRKNSDKLSIFALAVNSDINTLRKQIKEFSPTIVGVRDEKQAQKLTKIVDIPVLTGPTVLEDLAAKKGYDTLVAATVGITGIRATLKAIKNKKNVALANKETLVSAGSIVMAAAKEHNVQIMPIDSEHSALFQCLNGEDKKNIYKIHLTCSGGALRDHTKEELKHVNIDDALGHKTWNMGQKITIDSATLMNKGFEVIEAAWLYDVGIDDINVVLQSESIIHSMIEYSDGSIMAQLCNPDMALPIQYALSYPQRWDAPLERFDFSQNISFGKPDLERFPCLQYAYEAFAIGGTMPAVMNAANDHVVGQFLSGKCAYLDISKTIKSVMNMHKPTLEPTLEEIESAINEATKNTEKALSYQS